LRRGYREKQQSCHYALHRSIQKLQSVHAGGNAAHFCLFMCARENRAYTCLACVRASRDPVRKESESSIAAETWLTFTDRTVRAIEGISIRPVQIRQRARLLSAPCATCSTRSNGDSCARKYFVQIERRTIASTLAVHTISHE